MPTVLQRPWGDPPGFCYTGGAQITGSGSSSDDRNTLAGMARRRRIRGGFPPDGRDYPGGETGVQVLPGPLRRSPDNRSRAGTQRRRAARLPRRRPGRQTGTLSVRRGPSGRGGDHSSDQDASRRDLRDHLGFRVPGRRSCRPTRWTNSAEGAFFMARYGSPRALLLVRLD